MLSIQSYKLRTYIIMLMISLGLSASPMNITVGLNKSNDGEVLGYRIYFYSHFIGAGITYADYFDKKTEDLHTFNQGSFAKTEIKDDPEFYTVQEISEEMCGKLLFFFPDYSKIDSSIQPQNVNPAKKAPIKADKPVIVAFTLDDNIYKAYKSMDEKPFKLINGNYASKLKSKLYGITNLFTSARYISVVGKLGMCFILTSMFPLDANELKKAEELFQEKLLQFQYFEPRRPFHNKEEQDITKAIHEANYYPEIESLLNNLKPYVQDYNKLSNDYDFNSTEEYYQLQELEDKIFTEYKRLKDRQLKDNKNKKDLGSQTENDNINKTIKELVDIMKIDIDKITKSAEQRAQEELSKKFINENWYKNFNLKPNQKLTEKIEKNNFAILDDYARLASLFIQNLKELSRTKETIYIDAAVDILNKIDEYLIGIPRTHDIETLIDTPGGPEFEPVNEINHSKMSGKQIFEMAYQPQNQKKHDLFMEANNRLH